MMVLFLFLALLTSAITTVQADTSTWYMRSDTHSTHGIVGYKLSPSQSATNVNETINYGGDVNVSYGVRVWNIYWNGTTVELTSGIPTAVVSRSVSGGGLQSANWTCAHSNILDVIMIRIYQRFASEAWTLRVTFLTYNETLIKLSQNTWTFHYYTKRSYEFPTTTSQLFWGSTTYNTRVDVEYVQPSPQEVMLYKLGKGTLVGFIVFPYVNLIGNIFYGFIVFGLGLTLYRRYEKIVPVALGLMLFGGVGGVATMLIPAVGLQLAWGFLMFGVAILLFKLVKGAG